MRTKNTSLLFFGLIISVSSFSQFSAGFETGVSMGNVNSPFIGYFANGASVRFDMPLQNKLDLTCSIGYLSFSDKVQDGFPTGNSIVPVMGGVKYYFSEASKGLYAGFDLGMNFFSHSYTSKTDAQVGFSPGVGYRTTRWDLAGRCNAISHASYFSLRVAYVFRGR